MIKINGFDTLHHSHHSKKNKLQIKKRADIICTPHLGISAVIE
jgi:hypothetical protein